MARQSSRLAAKRNTSNLDQSRRTIEKLDLGVASNDSKVKKMKSEAKAQANTAAKTKGKAKKPRVPPKKRV
ncbi:hypothetical protein VNI00_007643 [Paramarasmius palmivorus]|uniref:Uncharacterized protein n=1 Tax=Paramarasmius palmivorus TaxID=297713 RepID=A0AAW0D2D1_9AGAR